MHYIILDTNIFFDNFFLDTYIWKELLVINNLENFEIVVPRFIFYEVVKKYGDSIKPAIKTINNSAKYRLMDDSIQLDENNIIEKYKTTLKSLFKKYNIKLLPYPESKDLIKYISYKYFKNKKPFGLDKKSFQDAIIWHSILDFSTKICSSDSIYFITKNYRDFSNGKDEKNTFHSDFLEDIEKNNCKNISLYEDTKAFFKKNKNLIECIKKKENDNSDEKIEKRKFDEKIEHIFEKYTYDSNNIIISISKTKLIEDDLLDKHVQDVLFKGRFIGKWIQGPGENGYFDKNNLNIHSTRYFWDTNNYDGCIFFYIKICVSHDIYDINPNYEDIDDDEYIYEYNVNSNFTFNFALEFKIKEEIKQIKYNELDSIEIKDYVEFGKLEFI